MVQIAAYIFIISTAIVIAFQFALICGAPWGELTLGGRWRGALPLHVRLVAAFSLALLLGFGLFVFARAQIAFLGLHEYAAVGTWVVVGYCVLGCVANAATPSPRERRLWLPVVACMLGSSLIVALS